MGMPRYFFDFRSDGAFSTDDEGLELSDADAAHEQAVGALADGICDSVLQGANDQFLLWRYETTLGAFCKFLQYWNPNFSENSDPRTLSPSMGLH
jgi:hypothetical protein